MAVTRAIVHSTVSGQMRRVIADDDGMIEQGLMPDGRTRAVICHHADGTPSSCHPLLPGESVLIDTVVHGEKAADDDPHAWRAALWSRLGYDPPDLMVALCNAVNGKYIVDAIVHADIDVDDVPPGVELMADVYSSEVIVGCSYDETSGLFTHPGGVIPPGTPGNRDGTEPITVPPYVIERP